MSSLMEILQCAKAMFLTRTPVQTNPTTAVALLVDLAQFLSTGSLLAEREMRFHVEEQLLKGLRV